MKNNEKFTYLMDKAINSGFKYPGLTDEGALHFGDDGIVVDLLRGGRSFYDYTRILFNHDFVKVIFGEERVVFTQRDFNTGKTFGDNALPIFMYRLQQAVISDDPIEYMYKAAKV